MKFLPLIVFSLLPVSVFSQAPSCSTQTVVGTCVNGFLVDGRHYIFDSAGKVVQIRLYLDGNFVGTALINDTVPATVAPAPKPKEIIRIPNVNTVADKQVVSADSIILTVDCASFKMSADTSRIPGPPTVPSFNGTGSWIIYKDSKTYQKGYFINHRLQCGLEYVYKKGKLRSVKVYQEGKVSREVKVPKRK